MTSRKIYKIAHQCETVRNPENLPVPHRSDSKPEIRQHIHARNSAAFITQLLSATRQNTMRPGRFERTAKRAGHAYNHAAKLPHPAAFANREKHLFI